MGCAISSGSDQLSNVRVFDVANIDDGGQERSAGKIEVTEAELILHYPGRQSIRWPLQSLRRYGYNDHLFSFESGRRCPTGHGIYAFRCVNAEMLFHQLQQAIVRAGEERARNADQGPRREDHYLPTDWSSIGSALQQQRIGRIGQVGRLDNRFADYISYPHISASWRTYVNQHIANHHPKPLNCPAPLDVRQPFNEGSVQYADLDLPVFCDAIEMEDYDEEADVFQSPEIIGSESFPFRSTYVNVPIPIGNAIPLFSRESRTTWLPSNAIVSAPPTSSRTAKVTYAQLDLDTPGPSPEGTVPGPAKPECSPRDKSETYAAIDFQRTRALSTKTTESEDEGFRKTRHNSNIEMLTRN